MSSSNSVPTDRPTDAANPPGGEGPSDPTRSVDSLFSLTGQMRTLLEQRRAYQAHKAHLERLQATMNASSRRIAEIESEIIRGLRDQGRISRAILVWIDDETGTAQPYDIEAYVSSYNSEIFLRVSHLTVENPAVASPRESDASATADAEREDAP